MVLVVALAHAVVQTAAGLFSEDNNYEEDNIGKADNDNSLEWMPGI